MDNNLLIQAPSPRSLPQALYAARIYTKGYYEIHADQQMSLVLRNLVDAAFIALDNPRTPVCDMQSILARFLEALDRDAAGSWAFMQSVLADARRLLGLPENVA